MEHDATSLQAAIEAWMREASTLVMSRFDRGRLRIVMPKVDDADETEHVFGGIRVRVNPSLPDGFVGFVGPRGRVLGILDLRGDHDVR